MLSDENISRIDLLFDVARLNDSPLSLGDLSLLLSTDATLAELEEAFARYPELKKYELRSGYVLEKGSPRSIPEELKKEKQATRNTALAAALARRLWQRSCSVIAVSGSTSYGSVKQSDDLDLFCLTGVDEAWIFFTKALLLLRFTRLVSAGYSAANVSCVMDFRFAGNMFEREQDALFARDGLNAIVLEGRSEYDALLRKAKWMERFFPGLYASRVKSVRSAVVRSPPSSLTRLANLFFFVTVGRYVKVRSMLENRRLARSGDTGRAFVTMLGTDHCIFESQRYRRMRQIYRSLQSSGPVPAGSDSPA